MLAHRWRETPRAWPATRAGWSQNRRSPGRDGRTATGCRGNRGQASSGAPARPNKAKANAPRHRATPASPQRSKTRSSNVASEVCASSAPASPSAPPNSSRLSRRQCAANNLLASELASGWVLPSTSSGEARCTISALSMRRATVRDLRKAVSALAARSSVPHAIDFPVNVTTPANELMPWWRQSDAALQVRSTLCRRGGVSVALAVALDYRRGKLRHKELRRMPAPALDAHRPVLGRPLGYSHCPSVVHPSYAALQVRSTFCRRGGVGVALTVALGYSWRQTPPQRIAERASGGARGSAAVLGRLGIFANCHQLCPKTLLPRRKFVLSLA